MSLFDRWHIHPRKSPAPSAVHNQTMPLDDALAAAQRRRELLHRATRVWNPTVRRLLTKLARARWPEQSHVGRFLVPAARIRQSRDADRVTWWAEHDIPPYDRYRCAAYFVDLEIGEDETCVLKVRNGQGTVRLERAAAAELERALAVALSQPPAIIPRQMGEAWD